MIKKITFKDYKDTKWSGGLTSEIFIYPENASVGERNFSIRVSTATTEVEKSTFSDYSSYTRYISTFDNPLKLLVNGEEINLKPFEIFKFSGEDKVESFGKVRDFNLIYKNNINAKLMAIEKKVEIFPLALNKAYILTAFEDSQLNNEDIKELNSVYIENEEKITLSGKFFLAEFEK